MDSWVIKSSYPSLGTIISFTLFIVYDYPYNFIIFQFIGDIVIYRPNLFIASLANRTFECLDVSILSQFFSFFLFYPIIIVYHKMLYIHIENVQERWCNCF